MLNLLLSILAIAMASVMTYSLVTQIELQNAFQDSRENNRRLDAAADALTSRLGRLPNIDSLLAPAPNTSFGWATLPASIKGNNSTVDGIRFLYCPIGHSDADDSMLGNSALTIGIGSSASYTARVRGGYVTNSDLTFDSTVSEMRPVAILVAAGRKRSTPPRCDSVRTVNGRPIVEGGLARVILDHRSGVASFGASESTGVKFFVDFNGSGNGLSIESPTSLDAALSHYVSYRPASMSIHVLGYVYASSTTWDRFVEASRDSELRLKISGLQESGSEERPGIWVNLSQPWHLPAETLIDNVTLYQAPSLVVGNGDRLQFSGNVGIEAWVPQMGWGLSQQNVIDVVEGGHLKIKDSSLAIYSKSKRLISNQGSVSIDRSSITAILSIGMGIQIYYDDVILLRLGQDSSFSMVNSSLSADHFASTAIVDQGAQTITGSGSSVILSLGAGSSCWRSEAPGVGLKWSDNGNTKSSQVKPEGLFAAPGQGASPTQIEQYDLELGERLRARYINSSNYSCYLYR